MSGTSFVAETGTIRSSAILTTSFVNSTAVNGKKYGSKLTFFIDFTLGSLTTAEFKIVMGIDGTNFYDPTVDDFMNAVGPASNIWTVPLDTFYRQRSAGGSFYMVVPALAPSVALAVKGTGTTSGSSCTIQYALGQ